MGVLQGDRPRPRAAGHACRGRRPRPRASMPGSLGLTRVPKPEDPGPPRRLVLVRVGFCRPSIWGSSRSFAQPRRRIRRCWYGIFGS